MAKKGLLSKLFSGFFSIMLKIVPFIFDIIFSIIKFIIKFLSSMLSMLASALKTEIKKKEISSKKPKTNPVYADFEILKTLDGSFEQFEHRLLNSKSTIGLILGARGSGKSALGLKILENVAAKTSKPICTMGFLEESLPEWMQNIEKIDDIKNGSFVLIDEGGVLFSSRGSMSNANKILSEFLLVARHKDLSILFISQNSANLEVNAIRQADYLLLRKSSLLQKDFERKKIKEVYEEAEGSFKEFSSHGSRLTYIYSDQFRGYAANELPSFWSEKTSKAFRDFKK